MTTMKMAGGDKLTTRCPRYLSVCPPGGPTRQRRGGLPQNNLLEATILEHLKNTYMNLVQKAVDKIKEK